MERREGEKKRKRERCVRTRAEEMGCWRDNRHIDRPTGKHRHRSKKTEQEKEKK